MIWKNWSASSSLRWLAKRSRKQHQASIPYKMCSFVKLRFWKLQSLTLANWWRYVLFVWIFNYFFFYSMKDISISWWYSRLIEAVSRALLIFLCIIVWYRQNGLVKSFFYAWDSLFFITSSFFSCWFLTLFIGYEAILV